jgi:hypothetical protein
MKLLDTETKKIILEEVFPMFDLAEGQIVSDYDLVYFKNRLLSRLPSM